MTTLTAAPAVATSQVDPAFARAEFFFDLELLELNATIAQAAPRGVAKY
jgi:hypothetical protein